MSLNCIRFCGKTQEAIDNMQKQVILKNQLKLMNIKKFEEALRKRELVSEHETLEDLRVFQHKKKNAFREFEAQAAGEAEERSRNAQSLEQLEEETLELKNSLMDIEIQLVEELEVNISEFERKLIEIVNKDMDPAIENGFKKIQEAINEFNIKLTEIVKQEQEKFKVDENMENATEEEEERYNVLCFGAN